MTIKLNRMAVAVAVALAGVAGSAVAAPEAQLYFTQNSGWLNPLTDGDAVTTFNGGPQGLTFAANGSLGDPAGTYSQLAWTSSWSGGNGNTSSLTISSYSSQSSPNGGVWNAGDWFRIDSLVQNNQVLTVNGNVPNPNPLWVADVLGNFRVFTADASGANTGTSLVESLDSKTRITYWETTNTNFQNGNPNPGACNSPNPLGSACDDIYTVLQLSLAPVTFTYNGYQYTVSFRLESDTALICDGTAVAPCSTEPGAQPGTGELLKVYAAEGSNSTIYVAAAWNAEQIPVPEPSVMALMGAGVLGLGMVARRRRSTGK